MAKTKKTQKKIKSKTQKNCDSLLTPIIKKMYPRCFLCGAETEVAHHFMRKSVSLRLRYDLKNLINLCHACHCRLHQNNESYWASVIAFKKGTEWFEYLEQNKHTIKRYINYNKKYEELENILDTPCN